MAASSSAAVAAQKLRMVVSHISAAAGLVGSLVADLVQDAAGSSTAPSPPPRPSGGDDAPSSAAAATTIVAPATVGHPLEMPDILILVLQRLDDDTLVRSAPLVCKSWCEASHQHLLWHGRVNAKLPAQLPALAQLGAAVSLPHAYLALHGRNLLRNPAFRRDANLQLGRNAFNRWQRNAWVSRPHQRGQGRVAQGNGATRRMHKCLSPTDHSRGTAGIITATSSFVR